VGRHRAGPGGYAVAKRVIAVKKPTKKAPPHPVLDPDPPITAPVISTPTLGQVHQLGPPPRNDLVAVDLALSSPDIAPQFKRPPAPAKGPAKAEVLDEIFSRRDLSREEQRRSAHERYPEITETELREAERKHKRKRGPQPRHS
jgi:hypothetical protein